MQLKYQNTHSVEIGQQLIMLDFIFIEACFSNFNSLRWFSDFAVGQDMLQWAVLRGGVWLQTSLNQAFTDQQWISYSQMIVIFIVNGNQIKLYKVVKFSFKLWMINVQCTKQGLDDGHDFMVWKTFLVVFPCKKLLF